MISVINMLGLGLGAVYASLMIYAGISQLGKTEFPDWTLKMLALIGFVMDLFILLSYFGVIWAIAFIVLGLIGLQVIAVYNGWYLYKKVNYKHQSIRVVLSICIIILLVL